MSSFNKQVYKRMCRTSKHDPWHIAAKCILKYDLKKRTPYENRFNGWLCNWRLKHINQAVIPPYIADFLLPEYNLIIELDGSQHDSNLEYDTKRTIYLESLGYKVLRVKNTEMLNRAKIEAKLSEFIPYIRFQKRIRVEGVASSCSALNSKANYGSIYT